MIENLLIIKLSAIGDVLMATPSFAAIRKKHPNTKIYLLVGEWSKPVVENNPNIDEIISVDENIFWQKKIFALTKLYFKLRKTKFNIIYIMHWSNFFNFFALLLGAKERIGFDRFGKSMFLTRKVPFTEGEKGIHTVERYLNLVDDNYKQFDLQMKIYLTDKEIQWTKNFIKEHNLVGKKVIAIAPGGGNNPKSKMPIRCWPIKNYIALTKKILTETDYMILFFGSNDERHLSELISSEFGDNKKIINLIGKTNLRETISLMQFCDLAITNDSAPLHMAAAVNTKTISIFGPTAPHDKVPIGKDHYYFYKNFDCSPCYKYGKFPDCQTLNCLNSITVEEVFKKIEEVIL